MGSVVAEPAAISGDVAGRTQNLSTETIRLDHIAIAGQTLAEATDWTESRLGVALQPGGAHDVFGTHNELLGLADGLYLEVIAIDPSALPPERTRWFDLDRFQGPPRLTNWICQVEDLDAVLEILPQAGVPVSLSRGDLRWRMAVPKDGILPYDNCFPALIEWQSPVHPSALLTSQGCRLSRLIVSHPQVERLEGELALYLDRSVIVFEKGPAGLHADIETPTGTRHL